MILKKSPGGTIIPGGTFIRESRVAGLVTPSNAKNAKNDGSAKK